MKAWGRFARHHSKGIQEGLAWGAMICGGVSAGIFAAPSLHFSWIGLVTAIAALLLQLGRLRLSNDLPPEAKKAATKKFLDAAECMLAFRDSKAEVHTYCHTVDLQGKWLVPFCCGGDWRPEKDRNIPLDNKLFVIVNAFDSHDVKRKDLKPEERDKPGGIPIWEKMRCVLAAPIRDFENANCEPLGTFSLAGSLSLKQLGWDTVEAERICRILASGIYELLKE